MKNLKELDIKFRKNVWGDEADDEYSWEAYLDKETIDFYKNEVNISFKNNSIYLKVAETSNVETVLKIGDHATTLKDVVINGKKQVVVGYKYLDKKSLEELNHGIDRIQEGDIFEFNYDEDGEVPDWDLDEFKEFIDERFRNLKGIICGINDAEIEAVELKSWEEVRAWGGDDE